VAKRLACSWVSKTGTNRITRSWVMEPTPLRMETAAAKAPPRIGRVRGETRYFPTRKGVCMYRSYDRHHAAVVGCRSDCKGHTQGAHARRMNSVRRPARRVTRRGLGAARTVGPQLQSGDLAKDGDQLVISTLRATRGGMLNAKTGNVPRSAAPPGAARWRSCMTRLRRLSGKGVKPRVTRPCDPACLHCRKNGGPCARRPK
jgi:hypothetical protein